MMSDFAKALFKEEIFNFFIDYSKKKIYTLDVDEMDMVY